MQKIVGFYQKEINIPEDNFFVEIGESYLACWVTTQQNELSAFEMFYFFNSSESCEEILHNASLYSTLLEKQWAAVKVIWNNNHVVCVPSFAFAETFLNEYLFFLGQPFDLATCFYNKIHENTIVFSVSEKWLKVLNNRFTQVEHIHKHTCSFYSSAIQNSNNSVMQLSFYPQQQFGMAVYTNGKLCLYRNFLYTTSTDVLYYVLSSLNKIEIENIPVVVDGFIQEDSELFVQLRSYIEPIFLNTSLPSTMQDVSIANSEYPVYYMLPFIKQSIV